MPAQAVVGNTAGVNGSPTNKISPVVTTWGAESDITMTVVKDGADIDLTLQLSTGPTATSASYAANSYRLDAFVRLDGTSGRGERIAGTPGTTTVNSPAGVSYPTGVTFTKTYAGLALQPHTFTLTDLLLDNNGGMSGGGFGTAANGSDAAGFDSWYNKGATPTDVVTSTTPIGITEAYVNPSLVTETVSGQITGVTNAVRGSATNTVTVSGEDWDANIASGGFTAELCDAAGANCDAAATNTLVSDGAGELSGTVSVIAASTKGARGIKVTNGTDVALVPIKVLDTPSLTTTPATGPVGTVVTITGSNWNPLGFGVAHASVDNPNGFCFSPGTIPCMNPGNYIVGPYVPGANTPIQLDPDANGDVNGSVTVTDPGTKKIQYSQKTITAGAPSNTNISQQGLDQAASKANGFVIGSGAVAPSSGLVGVTTTLTVTTGSNATDVVTVTWGDGSAPEVLAAGVRTATHKYTKDGVFPVTFTLTNDVPVISGVIAAGSVTVTKPAVIVPPVVKDTTKPVVKIKALKTKASKNKKVTGKITDNVGAKSVTIKLIEKRGKKWYAFTGKKWVKQSSKKKAFKKAKALTDKSVSKGWKIKVKGLKKGKVYVSYFGTDKAGNKSKKKTYSKKLK